MDKSRRIRLEHPERRGPVRRFAAPDPDSLMANDGGGSTNGFHPSEPAPGAANDAISDGVRRAYQVIDQYVKQGRLAAEQFVSQATGGATVSTTNFQVLFEQMMRRQTELLPLWLELLGALANSERPFVSPSSSGEARPQRSAKIAIEISTKRPAQVELQLHSDTPLADLTIPGLHPVQGDHPPIREIAFQANAGADILRVRLPDDQPPGIYAGIIVERESGHACGSVTIRVRGD